MSKKKSGAKEVELKLKVKKGGGMGVGGEKICKFHEK